MWLYTGYRTPLGLNIWFYFKENHVKQRKIMGEPFTCTPLREATPMYRKTPYRTGIGMNYIRNILIVKLLNGFVTKWTDCLAYYLKCSIKCYSFSTLLLVVVVMKYL